MLKGGVYKIHISSAFREVGSLRCSTLDKRLLLETIEIHLNIRYEICYCARSFKLFSVENSLFLFRVIHRPAF